MVSRPKSALIASLSHSRNMCRHTPDAFAGHTIRTEERREAAARVNRRPAARAVLWFPATARIDLRTRPWHVPTDSVLVTVLLPQLALCENLDRAAGTLGSMCALDDCDPVRPRR